ncbi:MAG: 50S ribosomal protein L3 [Porticoccus sp.]|jgi:large subunit ribosomal protein L3|nr:50S ribosomal protein L3 [Porticoccus sp.]|tara:strand:+ start:1026 stop:1658 length:633 start_codon:yes stop_codon:yes gene_type:complete
MTIGIVGRKSGMTRIFNDKGASIPVTVVEATPNRITQIKTDDVDGYSAVQVTVGNRHTARVSKSEAGHFAKAGVEAGRGVWELRLDNSAEVKVGEDIAVDQFSIGQKVDVTGTSKGKGYAGVIKRWNFQMQDATHGNSLSHRAHGSTGQCQTPGRVWKGKKMSGHMGSVQVTTQNLEIVRIDSERNLLLIKGAVPGAPGGDVIVRFAEKS